MRYIQKIQFTVQSELNLRSYASTRRKENLSNANVIYGDS